jgi:hypothetical protein
MGQFALGIRSLLFKAAIFVVMAALLAWALGGTLFPRPSKTEFPALSFAGHDWMWRVSVYDRRAFESRDPSQNIQWELIWIDSKGKTHRAADQTWVDVAGPVVNGELMYFGGREGDAVDRSWSIYVVDNASRVTDRHFMPDRLAVEQQLARIKAGLPLQNAQIVESERRKVLDPSADSADKPASQD